ncbi:MULTISPECIES: GntR family transcriptional regulator [Thermomonosporaceae]|uniref:GntR family transcriptional regulator n=1 Tax=Thermomonosporaceae TaxID=2012 RepID=UPI00255AB150|nr:MULTISPECIES: GntR family transcriptional regulator [Thermomonosporaceae]MDL4771564.1 GntR family transcriptional regulator [Actinomadura xylanilytica]
MGLERPRARYRQVADDLRAAIVRGEFGPGDALPSQPELARRHGLNQTSINRAITLLEAEGLIRTEHGRGSFVLEKAMVKRVRRIPARGDGAGSSFAEEMRSAGLSPRTELVQVEAVGATEGVAGLLGVPAGEQVLVRRRHMFADERPVQMAASYIPLSKAGSVDLALPDTGPAGIYRRLAERGHQVVRFVEETEARRPLTEEMDFLRISRAQYVLEVQRLALGEGDEPLEVALNVFPSHLWRLSYEWAAGDEG